MKRRTKVTILVIVNLFMLGHVTYLLATRDVRVRVAPLQPQQITVRDDLYANTCERAVFLATDPDAVPITRSHADMIDAEQATRISMGVLNTHAEEGITLDALTTAPMLLSADIFSKRRTVWGQLWLPPDANGQYGDGFVIYIDAMAAVPLMLFTDVNVKDVTDTSCVYPVDRRAQFESLAPFLYGTAMMLISFGLVLDYRDRTLRFVRGKRY